eukprot:6201193-Pleurochrysis_carterae.AAC.2
MGAGVTYGARVAQWQLGGLEGCLAAPTWVADYVLACLARDLDLDAFLLVNVYRSSRKPGPIIGDIIRE